MILFYLFIVALLALATGYALGILYARSRIERQTKEVKDEGEKLRMEVVALKTRLEAERDKNEQLREMEHETLRQEIKTMGEELARRQSDSLRATNREQMETLLGPLGKDIQAFKESFTVGRASMDVHIKTLMERTMEIGREANELTRALRSDSKKQGNWGEAILNNILEVSGLRKGHDFFVQGQETDEDGKRLIPDVVVYFPSDRKVIVDSKVSLTAFTNYVAADEPADQARYLKDHVLSVRKHVKELSEKKYDKVVSGAIGYVLLFIPNEAAYIAAVENDPSLATDAYARHVIILNPTNLLMALQLAYNLWQSEKQSQSVQEIYESADKLYTKFTIFARSFNQIGSSIKQLGDTFEKAEKQLCTGRGNIIRQLENWKEKGLNTKAEIPDSLLEEAGE